MKFFDVAFADSKQPFEEVLVLIREKTITNATVHFDIDTFADGVSYRLSGELNETDTLTKLLK